jgi:hypothetical protein
MGHQGRTSSVSVPAGAGARAAAAAEQDDDNDDCPDDCRDGETNVHGDRVANVVAVAVGGALDALLFHIVETKTGPPRIRQAPSAQVIVAADCAGLNPAGSVTIVCHVAVHSLGSHGRCAGGSAGGSAGGRAGGRERLSADR